MLSNCGVGKDSESPLVSKEIQPVTPKGNQPWILVGKADAEAEAPILWLPDAKNWLTGKDPDAGKDRRQEEKGTTEDKISWISSPIKWTWIWARSGCWGWTGKPGMLLSMGSQRVAHDCVTELNWREAQRVEAERPEGSSLIQLAWVMVVSWPGEVERTEYVAKVESTGFASLYWVTGVYLISTHWLSLDLGVNAG